MRKLIKLLPGNFFKDDLFLDKLIVTSIMEEYFSKKMYLRDFRQI